MTTWIRHYWADDDELAYHELGDDGWALRSAALRGADRRPVTAATLEEVLRIRDHGSLEDMSAYENRYGVLPEADMRGWQESDGVAEITRSEFERVWVAARRALDQRVADSGAAGNPGFREPG